MNSLLYNRIKAVKDRQERMVMPETRKMEELLLCRKRPYCNPM